MPYLASQPSPLVSTYEARNPYPMETKPMLRQIANSPFMFLVYTAAMIYAIEHTVKGFKAQYTQPTHIEDTHHD